MEALSDPQTHLADIRGVSQRLDAEAPREGEAGITDSGSTSNSFNTSLVVLFFFVVLLRLFSSSDIVSWPAYNEGAREQKQTEDLEPDVKGAPGGRVNSQERAS